MSSLKGSKRRWVIMSKVWTDRQKQAIEKRNTNLLLSAGAGSGKTAVLVERICQLVLEGNSIENMLIMTFTKAAVAEMKDRIAMRLSEVALECQADKQEWMHSQAEDCIRAEISTIHAFCFSVLKRHFQAVGLDPNFRPGNDSQIKVLKAAAIDRVMERYYEKGDERFFALLDAMNHRDDVKLRESIIALYEKMGALTDKQQFIETTINSYSKNQDGEYSVLEDLIYQARNSLIDSKNNIENQAKIISGVCDITYNTLMADVSDIEKVLESYDSEKEEFIAALLAFNMSRRKATKAQDDCIKTAIYIRDTEKKNITKLQEKFLLINFQGMEKEYSNCREMLSVLFELTSEFEAEYQERKLDQNIIDYVDMEQMTYKVLMDDDVAKEYKEHYQHIFVDEYQDTSYLQEAIINLISFGDNTFMVGDVKQSIYRFRMAQPELFINRSEKYRDGVGGECIDLVDNFRSSEAVVETVNAVFKNIMSKSVGSIEYGDSEKMLQNREDTGYCKLVLVGKDENNIDDESQYESNDKEAIAIANELFKLKQDGYEYKDMVILMRSRGLSDAIEKALSEKGIPCFSDATKEHVTTVEVQMVLNMLSVIDNPRQDIALLSTLMGPFCAMDASDLLKIRDEYPDMPFYQAASKYASEIDDNVSQQLSEFFGVLNEYISLSNFVCVSELIERLYDRFNLLDMVSAMQEGDERRKNLELLMVRAQDYEQTGKGIFGFLRFMDGVKNTQDSQSSARVMGQNDNVVRIMTMHKSKGLEFKVVALFGLSRNLNKKEKMDNIVFHAKMGLGIRSFNQELNNRKTNPQRDAIIAAIENESLSEELRVLYVAMTRARDVLIMTGEVKDATDKLEKVMDLDPKQAKSLLDFVLIGLTKQSSGRKITATEDTSAMVSVGGTKVEIKICNSMEISTPSKTISDNNQDYKVETEINEMKQRMDKYYIPKQKSIPAKVSVSALSEYDAELTVRIKTQKARMANEKKSQGGTEFGTLLHTVLEHINLSSVKNIDDIANQVEQMCVLGLITHDQAKKVDTNMVYSLINSELGLRMKSAQILKREYPFTVKISAREIIDDADSNSQVLVQGIIDACFIEDDKWVVIDYKTDSVDKYDIDNAAKNHEHQVRAYAEALEKLSGRDVKERWVYFLRAGQGIQV